MASRAIMRTLLGDLVPCEGIDLENIVDYDPQPTELGRDGIVTTYNHAKDYWDLIEIPSS